MLYVINGEDAPNSLEKRMVSRPSHLKRIQELQNEGRLISWLDHTLQLIVQTLAQLALLVA